MDEKNFGAASVTAKTVAHELSVPGSVADRKTAHTPGPWGLMQLDDGSAGGIRIGAPMPNGHLKQVATAVEMPGVTEPEELAANAARIVACVNACEGYTNEELAAHSYGDAVTHYRTQAAALRAQRDANADLVIELTGALRDCADTARALLETARPNYAAQQKAEAIESIALRALAKAGAA